jgi:hypothetical protein
MVHRGGKRAVGRRHDPPPGTGIGRKHPSRTPWPTLIGWAVAAGMWASCQLRGQGL